MEKCLSALNILGFSLLKGKFPHRAEEALQVCLIPNPNPKLAKPQLTQTKEALVSHSV